MQRTRLIMMVIAFLILLGYAVSGSDSTERMPSEREEAEPADMPKFSEIVYTRPDMDAIPEAYEALIKDLSENKLSLKQAISRVDDCYNLYDEFYTMRTVAELRYYHDITDTYYADESDWFLNQEPEMDRLFNELCSASANSELGEQLDEEFWGGWTVDSYRGQETAQLDPAFRELLQQEKKLLIKKYQKSKIDY